VEAAIAKGRDLPDSYLKEPIINPGDEFYLHAWFELDSERSSGMSIGPIPWSKIVEYGIFHGIDRDVLEPFIQVIRQMDAAYLKKREQQQRIDDH
jgi:hypothetical protein